MKKLVPFLLLFFAVFSHAQFSKTHYLPPITAQSGVVEDHYIYISTPNTTNVPFRIIENGGSVITGVVNNLNPYRHLIGTGDFTQLFTPKNIIGIVKNKGYVIESDDLVYANIRVNAAKNLTGGYNHAGGLVSKGNSALGKTFRLGAMLNPLFDPTLLNFASILATENGTKVTISNLPNGTILTDGNVINGTITVTLNKNESYVLALENNSETSNPSNSAKMIGALVESDKAVVVNSGSFCGSNSTVLGTNQNGELLPTGRDVGFDQIVPIERTGTEYIFAKGLGTDELERVLLVAHTDLTQVFLNGGVAPFSTLNKGEYVAIDGANFINGSMYVTTSEKVFAYQSIGGLAPGFNSNGAPNNPPANQNLFFVPPLNCSTPNVVDNIPSIQEIGNIIYTGGLNIITETGATVLVNNAPIAASPEVITGNPNFVKYTVTNLYGNIAVKSTKQVYVSYFATNGAATYGGYYSGFDLKPEIVSNKLSITSSACIPNVVLKISTLSAYDTFQWYKDDVAIPFETTNTYTPTLPGFYQVRGSISGCVSDVFSDKIPVSDCPKDDDTDSTNNNIDIDWDNDGLLNTFESNSSLLNQSNILTSSDYTATLSGTGTVKGYPNYGFVSEVPNGKNNPTLYKINFTQPETIAFQYINDGNVQTTPTTDFANGEGDFILSVPSNQTLTITDPFSDLVIDTNFDGIYESGVKEFTSFEIRFRFKSISPIPAGNARFKIQGYKIDALTFIHTNLSETDANRAAFLIVQTLNKDSDLDGIPDASDLDSDNDGIPDFIEAQGKGYKSFSGADTNKDGLDDAFEPGLAAINSDSDVNGTFYFVKDILDLDSDNDGIYDLVEAGHNAIDTNNDGKVDGAVGLNGLLDSLETTPDSGKINYTLADTDAIGDFNYIDLDSDDDGCNDVIEAGFSDSNSDGFLGNSPIVVNSNGVVTSGTNGYTAPNGNYLISNPIIITKSLISQSICELQNTTFEIVSNAESFQWQISTDGGVNWNSLTNNTTYSGINTTILAINKVSASMNGFQYRVLLNKLNNACGLTSAPAILTILGVPVLTNAISIVQCDNDTDGISTFNITEKNTFISNNAANESFSYYTTMTAPVSKDVTNQISNPIAYTTANTSIWARVENANGCFSVAQLNLIVSTTQITSTFKRVFELCDDYVDAINDDKDGISEFDFSSVTNDIQALLSGPITNYSINYYTNEADALAEINPITNTTSYRNTTPNQQEIWGRVESNLDNACFGLGAYITLIVNPKPNIDTNESKSADTLVCSNLPNFFIQLDAGLLNNTPANHYTYEWGKDGNVLAGATNDVIDVNEEGTYSVTVSTAKGCFRTRTLSVTASDIAHLDTISISDLSEFNTVSITVTGQGDYEYSMDLPNGPFQLANTFENVAAGIHDLYVNDKNGCGTLKKTIAVLGIPKYFTPNNDGYNDNWNIKGANSTFNSKAQIIIYDRYGKFLKQINAAGDGWDGTFIGQPLPADDYWYTIKLEDGREVKGHFSLKR